MKTLGNIIWIIFGGLHIALEYFIAGLILMITIIGIPFGLQSIKLVWYGVGSEDFLHDDVIRNREYLDAKGIKHEDMNTGGGHTWMNARTYLNATLQKFFK